MSEVYKVSKVIEYWSEGYMTTAEMVKKAKEYGYSLEREGASIHAIKSGKAIFSRKI